MSQGSLPRRHPPGDQTDGVGMEVLGLCVIKPSTEIKFHDKDALESAFSWSHNFSGKVAKLQILPSYFALPAQHFCPLSWREPDTLQTALVRHGIYPRVL